MKKISVADKTVFKGFYDRVIKAFDEDNHDELAGSLGLLRGDKTGPAKDERPPRASYARGETSRTLVDNVVQKAAT